MADKATEQEALEGTDDTKWMTPLKTRKIVDKVSKEDSGKIQLPNEILTSHIASGYMYPIAAEYSKDIIKGNNIGSQGGYKSVVLTLQNLTMMYNYNTRQAIAYNRSGQHLHLGEGEINLTNAYAENHIKINPINKSQYIAVYYNSGTCTITRYTPTITNLTASAVVIGSVAITGQFYNLEISNDKVYLVEARIVLNSPLVILIHEFPITGGAVRTYQQTFSVQSKMNGAYGSLSTVISEDYSFILMHVTFATDGNYNKQSYTIKYTCSSNEFSSLSASSYSTGNYEHKLYLSKNNIYMAYYNSVYLYNSSNNTYTQCTANTISNISGPVSVNSLKDGRLSVIYINTSNQTINYIYNGTSMSTITLPYSMGSSTGSYITYASNYFYTISLTYGSVLFSLDGTILYPQYLWSSLANTARAWPTNYFSLLQILNDNGLLYIVNYYATGSSGNYSVDLRSPNIFDITGKNIVYVK